MLQNKKAVPEAAFQDTLQVVSVNYSSRVRPMTPEILQEAKLDRIAAIDAERFNDASDFKFFFVGNVDKVNLKELVEKYIASLPATHSNEKWNDLHIGAPKGVVEKTVYKGQDPKSIQYIVFHGDFDYTRKNRILIDAVGKILSTRLLEVIREDKSSVYSIGASPSIDRFPSPEYNITIYYGTDPAKIDELKAAVFDQINDFVANGPTNEDLLKAKEKQIREHETNLRENRYWMSVLSNGYFIDNGSFADFGNFVEVVNSMTKDEVKAAFAKWFDFNNYYSVALKPESGKK